MSNETQRKNHRKNRTGIVVSNKMQKTIVVQVRRKMAHPVYGKVLERAVKFKVHDEKNEAKPGDRVLIQETRPLSKDKRWRLVQIVEKARVKAAVDLKDEFEPASSEAKS